MKVVWFEEEITAQKIKEVVSAKVNVVKVGQIPTGEMREIENPDGTTSIIPVTKKGVEIEFENNPLESDLKKLDFVLPYQRLGISRRDVLAELDELKNKVTKLEKE